ncbi:hypothetical protein GO755_29245 [Spirosoma sp. HMF4905]|uniref:Uncharacterized protein n=1 Tax=Spirosoma arboris TaxID=2682092 RepID=A0A7K1SK50_9BACT|nr:hypothetical protein [Spirosoma arboris]MVM34155.1 hypothetical protein [Spirosoma arboris]
MKAFVVRPSGTREVAKRDPNYWSIFGKTSRHSIRIRRRRFIAFCRNTKTRWIASWADKETDANRWVAALMPPFLKQDYERGFNKDLSHFYSGGSALGFLTVIIALAEGHPDT